MIVYLNGTYIPEESAHIGIHDAGFLYGHGAYETLRTYNGNVKYFNEHFARLSASAKALGIPLKQNQEELENALVQLVAKNTPHTGDDLRMRITLSAGNANFVKHRSGTSTMLMSVGSIADSTHPSIKLVTFSGERSAAHIKSTSMITNILAQKYAREHEADEALLVDHSGHITEGSFCNIFIVKSGVLYTPPNNILEGITRRIVLKAARDILPVKEQVISLDEALKADEAFITSTVRGVVPVKEIDDKRFDEPGTFTNAIRGAYTKIVFGNA